MDRQDVRVLEIGRGANFPRKPIDAECFSEFRPEDLYRDGAIVPQVTREINGRRAALTELALDAVPVLQ
jgi:hypothetical protein